MPTQFATFFLDGLHFGVAVLQVQEVVRFQRLTRVPLAPPVVAGLINLRGNIVTALDLRTRIDLPLRPERQLPTNVVVRSSYGVLSLLVDEIGDVVNVEDDRVEPVPKTVEPQTADLLSGVYKLEGRLLLLIDVERTVSIVGDRTARVGPRSASAQE